MNLLPPLHIPKPFLTVALATFAVCTQAQVPPVTAHLTYTHDTLSAGFGDWRTIELSVAQTTGPRRSVYGSALTTRRFGLFDNQFTLGAYTPVGPRLGSAIELVLSPTHQVLPKVAGTAQL